MPPEPPAQHGKRPPGVLFPPLRTNSRRPAATQHLDIANHESHGNDSLTSSQDQYTRKAQSLPGRDRGSATTTFSKIIEESIVPEPNLDDDGENASTTRSRHSDRTQGSSGTVRIRPKIPRVKTARAEIEEQTERKYFKLMGQVPPIPITGIVDPDEVFIKTTDLRAECRAVTEAKEAKEAGYVPPPKSPKKKIFGSMLNAFNKSNSTSAPVSTEAPPMPIKAAQILGTTTQHLPRNNGSRRRKHGGSHTSNESGKISHAGVAKSAHDTQNSQQLERHRHSNKNARQTEDVRSSGPNRGQEQDSSQIKHNVSVPQIYLSNDSTVPPPPPAKDTPPPDAATTFPVRSPLRRAFPYANLRDNFAAAKIQDAGTTVQKLPEFVLSPLPPDGGQRASDDLDEVRPFNQTDHTKVIEGKVMEWPFPDNSEASVSFDTLPMRAFLQKQVEIGTEEDNKQGSVLGKTLDSRSYAPERESVELPLALKADAESSPENSPQVRLLYTIVPDKSTSRLNTGSNNGSTATNMTFHSDSGVEPGSTTAQIIQATFPDPHDNPLWARDLPPPIKMSKPRSSEDVEPQKVAKTHVPVNQAPSIPASSSLTDKLANTTIEVPNHIRDFNPSHPSAVPSPLREIGTHAGPPRPQRPPSGPRDVHEHFLMTNEHLDVVAKTSWDHVEWHSAKMGEAMKKTEEKTTDAIKTMKNSIEAQFSNVTQQLEALQDTLDERLDHAASHRNTIHAQMDQTLQNVKSDVLNALQEQGKKQTQMETELNELKVKMQAMYKLLEQKLPSLTPAPAAVQPMSLPAQSSQNTALPGFYSAGAEHEHRSPLSAPPWNGRSGYSNRLSRENDSQYTSQNPYQYSNEGHYNEYTSNYYGFSPSPPGPSYSFPSNGTAK